VIWGLLKGLDLPHRELMVLELEGAAALLAGEPLLAAEWFTRALDMRASHRVETGLAASVGGVGAALWLAGRPGTPYPCSPPVTA
jgi:hypothetical protein